MSYLQLFEEIVEIMHTDYSGCKHKEGWDSPDLYKRTIKELEDAGTLHHVRFKFLRNLKYLAFMILQSVRDANLIV